MKEWEKFKLLKEVNQLKQKNEFYIFAYKKNCRRIMELEAEVKNGI